MKARTFNIMQYEQHPETGEPLINEDIIKVALAHKTLKRWAYICHDSDVYSLRDEADDTTGKRKAGDEKPRHWHIVCKSDVALEVGNVARWFGIPENFVDVPKGAGAFLDCVAYLTHEDAKQQELGKTLYDDTAVKANFDFREELNARAERKLKYGHDLSPKDRFRYEVLYNGKTLKECVNEDKLNYMHDYKELKRLRMEYIGTLNPPKSRINYYVTGRGGIGKGLISRAIARTLFPQIEDDDDIFFEVGARGATFEGYDGQPVIIWNDMRSFDLLDMLKSRGNVFNVFDTHPSKQKQNVKFGSVNLCNKVNIVNGIQSYADFLDGLAGEYTDAFGERHEVEDKGQSYRRFPMMIVLHEEDFDLLINRGFMENTAEFQEYIEYKSIRGNFQRIAVACKGNEDLARRLQAQTVRAITDKHAEVMEKLDSEDIDEQKILEQFADYGTTPTDYISGQLSLYDYDDPNDPILPLED